MTNNAQVIPLKISESYQIEYDQTLAENFLEEVKLQTARENELEALKSLRLYEAKLVYLSKKIAQEKAREAHLEN